MKKPKIRNVTITFVSFAFIAVVQALFLAQSSAEQTTKKEVKHEVADAARAIKDYSVDQRDQTINKVKSILDDLDARIDKLENRIDGKLDQMTAATRQKTRSTLRALRKKRNDLAEWYGGLKHSSADAWEDVKKGFSDAYASFADAWGKAEKEFNSGKN